MRANSKLQAAKCCDFVRCHSSQALLLARDRLVHLSRHRPNAQQEGMKVGGGRHSSGSAKQVFKFDRNHRSPCHQWEDPGLSTNTSALQELAAGRGTRRMVLGVDLARLQWAHASHFPSLHGEPCLDMSHGTLLHFPYILKHASSI